MRAVSSLVRRSERGATAIEYALGLGLLLVPLIVGIGALEDASADRLEARSDGISAPGDVGGVPTTLPSSTTSSSTSSTSTSTTVPDTSTTSSTSTTTGSATMTATGCEASDCNFTVSGAPQGSSFTWEVLGTDGKLANGSASPVSFTGTSASFTTRFSRPGSYRIQVVVGATNQGIFTNVTVTCTGSGKTEVCEVA